MKKRSVTRRSSRPVLTMSPLPKPKAPEETPNSFALNNDRTASALFASPPSHKALGTISDLKDLASSRMDDLKSCIDSSHSAILKELEASHSRLHKRFKIQTLACQEVMDEAENECKKMSEQISETQNAMKESYEEFMADAQATASRVCKTSIPELSQSLEKAIDVLRSRFGIPSN